MSSTGDRWVVLGLGVPVLIVGTLVAGFLAWTLSGGLSGPVVDFDVEQQPWSAITIEVPEGRGTLLFMRRPVDARAREHERRLRWVPAEGGPVELPMYDLGASPVSLALSWLADTHPVGPAVVVEDGRGTLLVDVRRGMLRRVWRGHGRTWLVDVSGPGVDGSGSIEVEGGEVRFVPVGQARVVDVDGDWPPAARVPLGQVEQIGDVVRWVPARDAAGPEGSR